jgi:phosphatidylglycerophosphate synthase
VATGVAAFDTRSSGETAGAGAEVMVMALGLPLLWLSAGLTAITGWDYFAKAMPHLRAAKGDR